MMTQREMALLGTALKGATFRDLESMRMIAEQRYAAERYMLLHTFAGSGETSIEGAYSTLGGMAESAYRFAVKHGEVSLARLTYVDLFDPDSLPVIRVALDGREREAE